jgi:hypothetical protein
MRVFYEVNNVPVNSVLLLSSQEDAINFQRGDISLAVCPTCGFISNLEFDPALTRYSASYEATQGYSQTFNNFHRRLAQDLIDRYELHGKSLIEIGCDKGDFLTMLCEMGNNRGVGFDPAYVPGRYSSPVEDQLTFIADYYSEQYSEFRADFVCCKMTLEHIPDVSNFVALLRRSIGEDPHSAIFFQIPNTTYVLRNVAFWDVYYEHCSYFTKGSLARLFRRSRFDILDLWTDYDDQYLMIEARPAAADLNGNVALEEESMDEILRNVDYFVKHCHARRAKWQQELAALKKAGQKMVLWGGGSKGVAFLTTLGLTLDDVQYVVDINPNKTGTFMAGTGQEIVAPDFLSAYRPDVVIVMNPMYRQEIAQDLAALSLSPTILTM